MKFVDSVLVVDGQSPDGTASVAEGAGATVICQKGRGKGDALRMAFDAIAADIYVTIDGDGTYNALEIPQLLNPLLNQKADMVIGSRFLGSRERGAISVMNLLGNRVFNFFINLFYTRRHMARITDSQSGFRAFHKSMLTHIDLCSHGFEIETELTVQAIKQRTRIKDVPIEYRRRTGGLSKLNSILDGFRLLHTLFTCLW
jgi:glycosyltransferase involved in cell wall biosynthesis